MKKLIIFIITFFFIINKIYASPEDQFLLHNINEPVLLTVQCYNDQQLPSGGFFIGGKGFSNLSTYVNYNSSYPNLGGIGSIDMGDYVFVNINKYEQIYDGSRRYSTFHYIFDKKACSYKRLNEYISNTSFFIFNNNLYFYKSATELYEISQIPSDSTQGYVINVRSLPHNYSTINYLALGSDKYIYNPKTGYLFNKNNKSIIGNKFASISSNILINKTTLDISSITGVSTILLRDNFFTNIDENKNISTHLLTSTGIVSYPNDIYVDIDRAYSSIGPYGMGIKKDVFKQQNYYYTNNNLAIIGKYDSGIYYDYYQNFNDNSIYTNFSNSLNSNIYGTGGTTLGGSSSGGSSTSSSGGSSTSSSGGSSTSSSGGSSTSSSGGSSTSSSGGSTSGTWDSSSFSGFFSGLGDKISNSLKGLSDFISSGFSAIGDKITLGLGGLGDIISNIFGGSSPIDVNSLSPINTTGINSLDTSGNGIYDKKFGNSLSPIQYDENGNCSLINKDNLTFLYYSNGLVGINFSLQKYSIFNNGLGWIGDKLTGAFIGPVNTFLGLTNIIIPFNNNGISRTYCLFGKVHRITFQKLIDDQNVGNFTFFDYLVLFGFGTLAFSYYNFYIPRQERERIKPVYNFTVISDKK